MPSPSFLSVRWPFWAYGAVASPGSDRMSDRLSFSSTKYGPSVSAGRTMQDGRLAAAAAEADAAVEADAADDAEAAEPADADGEGEAASEPVPGAQAARSEAVPAAPNSISTSRRVRIRPTGRSSWSISMLEGLHLGTARHRPILGAGRHARQVVQRPAASAVVDGGPDGGHPLVDRGGRVDARTAKATSAADQDVAELAGGDE